MSDTDTASLMDARAAHLITALDLAPHPEGGHYRRIHRSGSQVQPQDNRGERAALTSIYFLLAAGEVGRWHRVASDEVWHHYEGAPLELLIADPGFRHITRHRLGPLNEATEPVRVVPAGYWQAAHSTGAFTLTGCTVGPGFDFADFELLENPERIPPATRQEHPDALRFV